MGYSIHEGSEEQFESSAHIDNPAIGDLAFFRADGSPITHHVGMLFDDETVIEARGAPYNRIITKPRRTWEAWHEFIGWNRLNIIGH